MIHHKAFRVEPWCLRETELDLDVLAQSESVYALSNGHLGWRANLDRLAFGFILQGQQLRVETTPEVMTYRLDDGDSLKISHCGMPATVTTERPTVCTILKCPAPRPNPTQPRGRAPLTRHGRADLGKPGATS